MKSHLEVRRRLLGALCAAGASGTAWAQPSSGAMASGPVASAPVAARRWIALPRVGGRLTAADIGLVVNRADPYSVEVGAAYRHTRRLRPQQVLEVEVPVQARLADDEFRRLAQQIDAHFGRDTQALALAWRLPFAVGCSSITGALALGLDDALCRNSCGVSRRSPYFASPSRRPMAELGMRLSMLLAAESVDGAVAMIERGVAADASLGRRGAPSTTVWFLVSDDPVRNVRMPAYPPAGRIASVNVEVRVEERSTPAEAERVLLVQVGRTHVERLDTVRFVPGALADHLTSTGGAIDGSTPQMSALAWIAAGATASHGTVSEPCARPEKFPHPQVLLLNYLQGCSAIEAYWRSVACPQQSLFVGEPLAAPFARV